MLLPVEAFLNKYVGGGGNKKKKKRGGGKDLDTLYTFKERVARPNDTIYLWPLNDSLAQISEEIQDWAVQYITRKVKASSGIRQ